MNENAKTYIRTLVNGNERLRILGVTAKTGFSFYIVHQRVDATTKKTVIVARGASAHYATLAETVTAVDAAVTAAKAVGWKTSAGPGGFKPKADAFDLTALPKPAAKTPEPAPEPAPEETPEKTSRKK